MHGSHQLLAGKSVLDEPSVAYKHNAHAITYIGKMCFFSSFLHVFF